MPALIVPLVLLAACAAAVALQRHGWLNLGTVPLLFTAAWMLVFAGHAYAGRVPLAPAMVAAAIVSVATLPVPLIAFLGWQWYRTGRARHQWNRWLKELGDDDWWSS